MSEKKYHVGLGVFGIYAGTLKNKEEWKDKSEVTREAIDAIVKWAESHHENPDGDDCIMIILDVPPAQPDITDEQAIGHLQASGWMQNHDKQMYEMGLKERLADDSDSYDALLPSAQPTTNCSEIPNHSDFVSRKAVREMVSAWAYDLMEQEDLEMALHDVDELPPVSAERQRGKKNEGYF